MMLMVWVLATVVLVAWSSAAWGLHALLAQIPSDWGHLDAWVDQLPASAWLERWFPLWPDVLKEILHAVAGALSGLGSVVEVLGWAIWAAWGLGVAVVLLLAFGGTMLVALIRKQQLNAINPPVA